MNDSYSRAWTEFCAAVLTVVAFGIAFAAVINQLGA